VPAGDKFPLAAGQEKAARQIHCKRSG